MSSQDMYMIANTPNLRNEGNEAVKAYLSTQPNVGPEAKNPAMKFASRPMVMIVRNSLLNANKNQFSFNHQGMYFIENLNFYGHLFTLNRLTHDDKKKRL